MAAHIPIAPVIVKPAIKFPTAKFSDHEANGAGTKLLQEEADAFFALCGAQDLVESKLNPYGDPDGQTALRDAYKQVADKASATQQIAMCGEVDQKASIRSIRSSPRSKGRRMHPVLFYSRSHSLKDISVRTGLNPRLSLYGALRDVNSIDIAPMLRLHSQNSADAILSVDD